jgi:hypothetical protein
MKQQNQHAVATGLTKKLTCRIKQLLDPNNLPGEQWKPVYINNSITHYHVSNLGRVKNTKRNKIKRQSNDSSVYLRIHGTSFHKKINRLVASEFIPNIQKLPNVIHIDRNLSNNHHTNLQWSKLTQPLNEVPVVQMSLEGIDMKTWSSANEASKSVYGATRSGQINEVCKGLRKSYKCFKWRFATPQENTET